MADEPQSKPKFEPPPWEREAFERFRAEREQEQAQPGAPDAAPGAEKDTEIGGQDPAVSEAEIETMMIGLRAEEPPATRANMAIINTVIGLFVGAGVLLIVEAALLFGRTRASGATGMLGATASLLVMLAGIGFVGGAILLFRKYHR
jgi:hypothetical protein